MLLIVATENPAQTIDDTLEDEDKADAEQMLLIKIQMCVLRLIEISLYVRSLKKTP